VVDMEAYALAKVCKLQNINFKCFKFISDGADENAKDHWIDNCKKGSELFLKKAINFSWLK
jgi:adenosylhomocysteine nucleosidase